MSSDNQLRIYECLEQPALASWQLADEVDIPSLPSPGPAGSSTRAGTLAHTLAPGTPMPTSGSGAALDGASVNSLLQAAQQQQQAQQGGGAAAGRSGGIREADGGWCVSWCKERYWGEVLAVGCGTSGVIKVSISKSICVSRTMLSLYPFRSSNSQHIDVLSYSSPSKRLPPLLSHLIANQDHARPPFPLLHPP